MASQVKQGKCEALFSLIRTNKSPSLTRAIVIGYKEDTR